MEEKRFSLKNVISSALAEMRGNGKKVLCVSIIQFVAFLITYFLFGSLLVSFVVYALFLPSQAKFLLDIKNGQAEDVFKIGKKLTPALLVSMLFVFVFGAGLILLIFPAVIFFANYALVFDIAGNGEKPVIESFKEARQTAKRHKGKLALLCLSFMLLLILLVGVGILIGFLFSLFLPALKGNSALFFSFVQIPKFYYVGVLLGIAVFLIFVMPVEVLAVSKMREAIEAEKEANEKEGQENLKDEDEKKEENQEVKTDKKEKQDDLDDRDDQNPADYIF